MAKQTAEHKPADDTIEELVEALIKKMTSVKAVVSMAVLAAAVGIAAVNLWNTKANASDVDEIKARVTTLEIHHAADDVQMNNVVVQQKWSNEILFTMAKQQLPSVSTPPIPQPTPATAVSPTKGNP